jgi:hypothetical protein
MAEALLAGVVLNAALSAGKKLAAKTQPLKISVESDSVAFSISPLIISGKLIAIRVQDLALAGLPEAWFNWDGATRTWDRSPRVHVGDNMLYIAAAAVNAGSAAGDLELEILDENNLTLAYKRATVQPWNGSYTSPNDYIGVETGSKPMPNKSYGITVKVTP